MYGMDNDGVSVSVSVSVSGKSRQWHESAARLL